MLLPMFAKKAPATAGEDESASDAGEDESSSEAPIMKGAKPNPLKLWAASRDGSPTPADYQ